MSRERSEGCHEVNTNKLSYIKVRGGGGITLKRRTLTWNVPLNDTYRRECIWNVLLNDTYKYEPEGSQTK